MIGLRHADENGEIAGAAISSSSLLEDSKCCCVAVALGICAADNLTGRPQAAINWSRSQDMYSLRTLEQRLESLNSKLQGAVAPGGHSDNCYSLLIAARAGRFTPTSRPLMIGKCVIDYN